MSEKLIDKNTVPAKNQTVNSSGVYYLGNLSAKTKILVLGNSITRHGPKSELGWELDCGMAASAPEKDYVHRLYAKLTEDGKDVYMRVRQASKWEIGYLEDDVLTFFEEDKAFNADIVVFRMGENIPVQNAPYCKEALRKFADFICPSTGRIVFSTCFWEKEVVDAAIRDVAKERGEVCLDGCLSVDESNMAIGLFAVYGVSIHPGDKGMEALADLFFNELKKTVN